MRGLTRPPVLKPDPASDPASGRASVPESGRASDPAPVPESDPGPPSVPDPALGRAADPAAPILEEIAPGAVWVHPYPVRYAFATFSARMTLIRLRDGRVIVHSPGPLDEDLKRAIAAVGPVGWIVAPGTFHHLHAGDAARAYPEAQVLICPGVERKQPDLAYDALLGADPPADWAGEIALQPVLDNRVIREVVLLHIPSRTLIVTDLIELIGDATPGVDRVLRFWWKWLTFMWNKPRPAPEYTLGWTNRRAAAVSLERILGWDFDRIVLAHGDLVLENAKSVARQAWARVLRHGSGSRPG